MAVIVDSIAGCSVAARLALRADYPNARSTGWHDQRNETMVSALPPQGISTDISPS